MPILHRISDELLVEALEAYAKMKGRAATNFKSGSAARTELEQHQALLTTAATEIKAGAYTPLEDAINKTKK